MTAQDDIVRDLLQDFQRFHSSLQIDSFITTRAGAGHTYGMYIQALRELEARWGSYRASILRRKGLVIDIEEASLLVRKLVWTWRGRIARKRAELRLEELRARLEFVEKVEPDRLREFKRFLNQAISLKEVIGELTEARREQLDQDLWLHKLRQKLAIDYLRDGKPSVSMLEILPALPPKFRKQLVADCRDPNPLMQWYESLSLPEPPPVNGRLSGVDLEALALSTDAPNIPVTD